MKYSRLLQLLNHQSAFLFGPRGTGKSAYVKQHYPDAIYIDLLKANTFIELKAHPNKLETYFPKDFSGIVIIDEVQKVPLLLDEVHRLIEQRGVTFILTGSSARKLKKQGVNLLAGRALTHYMHPLCAEELGEDFDLSFSLNYGHLPFCYQTPTPQEYLDSYIQTYLKEEVQQEGLTRNLGAFTRFLEVASFSQGEVLNMSEVARECHIERKLVESYFGILEDFLIATRLPSFTKQAKRRVVQHPKFYFFDVGVYRTLRPKGLLDTPEEIDGSAIETLVHQELRAVNAYERLKYDIYFWRTSNQVEVDFVLYGENGFLAIEVKRKRTITSKDLKGLRLFLSDYPMAKAYVFYGGEKIYYESDITILPLGHALQNLRSLLLGQVLT